MRGKALLKLLAYPMHYILPAKEAMETMKLTRAEKGKKGFTLIELVIVVATLAIIMSVALPNLARARQNADDTRVQKELQNLYTAIVMFETANGRKPVSFDELQTYISIPNVDARYELNVNV